jgi:hypothetical protein
MAKKYKVAMPPELDYITRLRNREQFERQQRIRGIAPAVAPAESEQDAAMDERIPYHLTPLGIEVVENGRAVAEFHRVRDFESYRKASCNAVSAQKKRDIKSKKPNNQRDCQVDIYECYGEEVLFGQDRSDPV